MIFLLIFFFALSIDVILEKRMGPIISKPLLSNSIFDYNAQAAWIPYGNSSALIFRAKNCSWTPANCTSWTQAGHSVIVMVKKISNEPLRFEFADNSKVIMKTHGSFDDFGVEDPMVIFHDGVYYMAYVAASYGGPLIKDVGYIATCKGDPAEPSCWKVRGPFIPNYSNGGGGILIREKPPHFMYSSSPQHNVVYSTSENLINWKYGGVLLGPRPDHFDARDVPTGPRPLPLSDGSLLFLYNTDNGHPIPTYGHCSIGWARLNGSDPTQVIERCVEPVLTPEMPYERNGLNADVVFTTGWEPLGNDRFLLFYCGADAHINAAIIRVVI